MAASHLLALCSLLISTTASWLYIRDTLQGKTKPNRAAWALWALAPACGTYVAWVSGVSPWALVSISSAAFFPFLILLASFVNPHSYWKLSWFDYFCASISLIALSFWFFANSPTIAILLLAVQDACATILIVKKAWQHPETETGSTFLLALLSNALAFPAIGVWDTLHLAFPLYLMLANCVLLFSIYRKRVFPRV